MLRRILMLGVVMAVTVLLLLQAPAWGQANGAGTVPEVAEPTWFDYFVVKGGYITLGLVALSFLTLALAVEHCFSIRRAAIVPPVATARIRELIEQRRYLDAVQFTAEDPSMLGYVVNAGLLEAANGFAAMERAVEESLEDRASRLFRKIEYLNVIGNVSPMIGLFGTVYGMILLFAAIHRQDAFPPPQEVADKISIALLTTFWGLVVAIPSLSAFAIFRNRIDVLTAECALTAERLLSVFKAGGAMASSGAPAATAAPPAARPKALQPQT